MLSSRMRTDRCSGHPGGRPPPPTPPRQTSPSEADPPSPRGQTNASEKTLPSLAVGKNQTNFPLSL